MKRIRVPAICLLLLILSGCGMTRYQVSTPDGVEVSVWNTKDYEAYELTAKKEQDNSWSVRLKEQGVSTNIDKLIDRIPTGL